MLGEQFPPIRTVKAEQVREIIAAAPLDKPVVGRLGRDRVVDRLGTQLGQVAKQQDQPNGIFPRSGLLQ